MKAALPWLLAAALVITGASVLHDYNVNWDEAVGDLFFGQRYCSFFTTFDTRYLDFAANPYPPGHTPNLWASALRNRPWEHYPVASTLATAVSRACTAAGLTDPFDGYHAFNLLIGAIFVILFYRFVEDGAGTLAACSATLLLALSPRIAVDALANVKDFAEMVFFSSALILFWRGVERGSTRIVLLSGAIGGLALGTKANALFLPVVIAAYLLWRRLPWRMFLLWCAAAAVVFVLAWPYLWLHPIEGLRKNVHYLLFRGTGTRAADVASPLVAIVFTTPPMFLLAMAIGAVPLVRGIRARHPFALLLTCWIAAVAGRLALPASVNFDGVRHFLELFPPLAAAAGMGIAAIPVRRVLLKSAVAAAFIVPVAVALATVHPFEIVYWNALAGGLRGAVQRQMPQASDYWALSYRIGMRWLNANAPPNSLLAVPIAEHTVRLAAPYRLRRDIRLVHITSPLRARIDPRSIAALHQYAARQPVFVMFVFRREWANDLVWQTAASVPPVAVWRVDGTAVLAIFRLPVTAGAPAPPPDRRP